MLQALNAASWNVSATQSLLSILVGFPSFLFLIIICFCLWGSKSNDPFTYFAPKTARTLAAAHKQGISCLFLCSSVTFCHHNYQNLHPSCLRPTSNELADSVHAHTANKLKLCQRAHNSSTVMHGSTVVWHLLCREPP